MDSQTKALPYGKYFGSQQSHQEVPGFSISLLTPTLRAEDVPLHTHENASFVFVLSGSYLSSADGARHANSSPMLIFNPAGTTHRDSFALAAGQFLTVSISDRSLRVALDLSELPRAAKAYSSGKQVETALRLAQELTTCEPPSALSMESICWELVSGLSGVTMWPGEITASWTGKAQELLRESGCPSLSIADIAQQLGLHPVYFARAFRKVFRCTPSEYRMRCRLRGALQLVRSSSHPLSDIALASGFYDQSHFSTAFRKHFGISPQAYRGRLVDADGSILPRADPEY